MFKKVFLLLSVILLGAMIYSFNASASESKAYCNATIDDEFANDTILVVLTEEASYSEKEYNINDFESYGCITVSDLTEEATSVIQNDTENELVNTEKYKRVLKLELAIKSKQNVLDTIEDLMDRDDIFYAGPDYQFSICSTTTNDPYLDDQWAIDDIDLKQAWDISVGTNDVIVGVIDTGIDGNHPDLMAKIIPSLCRDFTSGIEQQVYNPTDLNGHGTHVAGIIGGIGNNNLGISGTNWNVSLVSLKAFNKDGIGKPSHVGEAINYAQRQGIKILNLSARYKQNDVRYNDQAFTTILENYSGLVVCCAGNDSMNIDINPCYPASNNASNVLTVGAHTFSHERRETSNFGTNSVDIYAPGENILSTFATNICEQNVIFEDGTRLCELSRFTIKTLENQLNSNITWDNIVANPSAYIGGNISDYIVTEHHANGYHYMSGTSMATPYVTGVAALLLSLDPNLTATDLKYAIIRGGENISITVPVEQEDGTIVYETQNVKKLNAYNAVTNIFNSKLPVLTLGYYDQSTSQSIDNSSSSYYLEKNSMVRLSVQTEGNYSFIVSSTSPINVTLYNFYLNEVSIVPSYSNNNCTIEFDKELSVGGYFIKTNYINSNTSGTVNIEIDNPSHTHNFNQWIYHNSISHIELCACGTIGTRTQAHIISQDDITNTKARCLGCNALLDTGGDIGMGPGIYSLGTEDNIITDNGSYILPNGIIVLVEADIEAYLNGTLLFYDNDENQVM